MFTYFSDEEYQRVFGEFEDTRRKIASLVGMEVRSGKRKVIDLLAGHGYLSAELAKIYPDFEIHGTGLKNDLDSHLALKASDLYPASVWKNVKYVECDVTTLPFEDDFFDIAINFLGLEDVMMTRGESGLLLTISEVCRVVTHDGLVEITMVEYGDTPEERVAEEVWNSIGLNAVFRSKDFYIDAFADHGFELNREIVFEIRKKMTFEQAKEELQFACEQAPLLFKEYDVTSIGFDNLMEQFGSRIQKHGMAYYPNIQTLLFSFK